MEKQKWDSARDSAEPQDDWQLAEHNDNKLTGRDATELLTATDAYSADQDQDDEALYAAEENENDDDSEEDDEDETDSEEDDDELTDWGNVDPQSHPGFPDSNDPSGPGSAV
jgi:hypothetical protein